MTIRHSPNRHLIVFAREPRRGQGKTRLQSELGAELTYRLYLAFLKDMAAGLRPLKKVRKTVFYTGAARPARLQSLFKGWDFHRQIGANLGVRMLNAFKYAERAGPASTVIVGTDSLDVTPQRLRGAWRALRSNEVVFGPAYDGGYYLVGANAPDPRIFQAVEWGSCHVLATSLALCRRYRIRFGLLPAGQDIDVAANLRAYFQSPVNRRKAPETWGVFRSIPGGGLNFES